MTCMRERMTWDECVVSNAPDTNVYAVWDYTYLKMGRRGNARITHKHLVVGHPCTSKLHNAAAYARMPSFPYPMNCSAPLLKPNSAREVPAVEAPPNFVVECHAEAICGSTTRLITKLETEGARSGTRVELRESWERWTSGVRTCVRTLTTLIGLARMGVVARG